MTYKASRLALLFWEYKFEKIWEEHKKADVSALKTYQSRKKPETFLKSTVDTSFDLRQTALILRCTWYTRMSQNY